MEYKDLDVDSFTGLIKSFVGYDENRWSTIEAKEGRIERASGFANRLITVWQLNDILNLSTQPFLSFKVAQLRTRLNSVAGTTSNFSDKRACDFLAVEVKGIREKFGSISLTPREYDVATELQDRFYLFVVKELPEDPLPRTLSESDCWKTPIHKNRTGLDSSIVVSPRLI